MAGNATSDRAAQQLRGLLEENERLRERIFLLFQLNRQITESLDLPTVLQSVVEAACALTGARYGALAVFDARGQIGQYVTHGLSNEDRQRIGSLPQGRGLLRWLQHTSEPLRIPDVSQHPQSAGFPPGHPRMRSFLGVPIRLADASLGNLYLTEKVGASEFTPEDEGMLILLAAQAAMAIRNARMHERVERERRNLRTLVDTSPVGVMVVEARTEKVLFANRELERLAGIRAEQEDILTRYESTGTFRTADGLVFGANDLPIRRALRGETVLAEECRAEFSDGRSIPLLVNAAPVYRDGGTILAAIGIFQDMTPLEELEKLRSEFLGIVSHELKTPLTAIKGSAATVLGSKRTFDPDETRELFEIIDEQADRLRDLVDNLLDMTRIEAGRLSVTLEPIDLHSIIEEARGALARSGNARDIEIAFPADMPLVKGDRRRITQVFSNLLSNAAKFSPSTSPIRLEITRDSGTHLKVAIRDHGRGIAKEKLPHLFRKFSQVHPDSRGKSVGTGLGLAICKGIVEAHGGRIWAESEGEGKGSTFLFTVPTAPDGAVPIATDPARRSGHVGKVRRAGERTRILVVDDEPQVLRYLQRTLGDGGYHAIATSDSTQALGLIEAEEPDLVLLDVFLPGTTGLELLGRIREFSGVPVIFLTANIGTEDMVRALKMGADDYVAKPFSPSELLARIEAVLRRRVMPDTVEVRPAFVLDDLTVNFAERRVIRDTRAISLSATEYKLLYELATHAGMVLTHDQILQRVWGPEYAGETELVRSVIRNLRRKLGDDARSPRYIFTESQVGYRMAKPTQAS